MNKTQRTHKLKRAQQHGAYAKRQKTAVLTELKGQAKRQKKGPKWLSERAAKLGYVYDREADRLRAMDKHQRAEAGI